MIRTGFLARRTPLSRTTPLARGGRLAPVSKKRKAQARDWEMCKAIVSEREGGRCQWCHHVVPMRNECWGTLHFHHVRRRSQAPRLVCDPDNVVLIHAGFHEHVHREIRWAKKEGWIR